MDTPFGTASAQLPPGLCRSVQPDPREAAHSGCTPGLADGQGVSAALRCAETLPKEAQCTTGLPPSSAAPPIRLAKALSANVGNVFDTYGWNVSGDSGFSYSSPRTFSLSFVGDF